MFARVSTFKSGPETSLDVTDETASRVMALPGCVGFYFLRSADTGKNLAITLWDSADSLAATHVAANTIRADASAEQRMRIVGVEEFEVGRVELRG